MWGAQLGGAFLGIFLATQAEITGVKGYPEPGIAQLCPGKAYSLNYTDPHNMHNGE